MSKMSREDGVNRPSHYISPGGVTEEMKVKIPKVEGSGFISLDKVREMLKTSQEDDVVNQPSHYLFPGGVETIHLSRHLSSNGGQAVQYIARATRMDGRVKGSPVEDLKKAIVFIQDEIERMKG